MTRDTDREYSGGVENLFGDVSAKPAEDLLTLTFKVEYFYGLWEGPVDLKEFFQALQFTLPHL